MLLYLNFKQILNVIEKYFKLLWALNHNISKTTLLATFRCVDLDFLFGSVAPGRPSGY